MAGNSIQPAVVSNWGLEWCGTVRRGVEQDRMSLSMSRLYRPCTLIRLPRRRWSSCNQCVNFMVKNRLNNMDRCINIGSMYIYIYIYIILEGSDNTNECVSEKKWNSDNSSVEKYQTDFQIRWVGHNTKKGVCGWDFVCWEALSHILQDTTTQQTRTTNLWHQSSWSMSQHHKACKLMCLLQTRLHVPGHNWRQLRCCHGSKFTTGKSMPLGVGIVCKWANVLSSGTHDTARWLLGKPSPSSNKKYIGFYQIYLLLNAMFNLWGSDCIR